MSRLLLVGGMPPTSPNPTRFAGSITMAAHGNRNFHDTPEGRNETIEDTTCLAN